LYNFSIRKKMVENQVTSKQAMLHDGTAGPIPQAGFALEQNGIESRKERVSDITVVSA
jgi:hypothetical protein